jgi:hypothetical protein
MKKPFRPHSQLFLFSNTLDPRIEMWFSGNIIIEQELLGNMDICEEIKKLSMMLPMLGSGHFKYVTTVMNFKTANLLLVKLSGIYPVMSAFTPSENYSTLNRIFKLYCSWVNRMESLEDFQFHENRLLSYLRGKDLICKNLRTRELEILSSLHQNNDEIRDFITHEIRSKLLM